MADEFIAKKIIEGILFLSPEPVSIRDLARITGFKPSLVSFCLKELMDDYEGRGINVRTSAGTYRMASNPDIASYIEKFYSYKSRVSLSRPALETLAIIAYRQPITRGEIEEIRGVNVDGVMNKLLDLKLIRICGRADVPGHPVLFATSTFFLNIFGLNSLDDLPPVEGEFKPIHRYTPVALETDLDKKYREIMGNNRKKTDKYSEKEEISVSKPTTGSSYDSSPGADDDSLRSSATVDDRRFYSGEFSEDDEQEFDTIVDEANQEENKAENYLTSDSLPLLRYKQDKNDIYFSSPKERDMEDIIQDLPTEELEMEDL